MPLKIRKRPRSLGRNRYGDPLHRVVRVALQVPGRLERLGVARGVGRATRYEVLARCRVPFEPPPAPGVAAERLVQNGGTEGGSAVGGHLHLLNAAESGPRAAAEGRRAGL